MIQGGRRGGGNSNCIVGLNVNILSVNVRYFMQCGNGNQRFKHLILGSFNFNVNHVGKNKFLMSEY